MPSFALYPDDQAQVLAPDGAVLAATQYLAGKPAPYRLMPGSATPVRQAAANGIVPGDALVVGEHMMAAPGMTTTGNHEELFRMFRNIVDNAARYARHRVLITAVCEAASTAVQISDDGPGIPAAERERVFARFVRLDPSRRHASGSAGLGLAIARDIATAHGATITLAEAEHGGTRAVITLARTAGQRD